MKIIKNLFQYINQSITRKYLNIFLLVLIIPILLIYNLIIGYAEQIIKKDIVTQNRSNTDMIVKRLNAEMTDVVLQLQLIAGKDTDAKLDYDRMYTQSKQAISQSSIIHSIYFLDESKKIRFEAPFIQNPTLLYYDYPNFEQVRWSHNYAVSDNVQNYSGDTVVTISVPVFSVNKKFHGVLVAEVSKDYLSEVLKSVSVGRGHFSYITDSSGTVIASTAGQQIGQTSSLQELGGFSESMVIDWERERSVAAYQAMQDGWDLVYGVQERIAFEPIHKLSFALRISFVTILVLCLFFTWLGMKSILYPIIRLTMYARTYHPLRTYIPLNEKKERPDELGQLTNTIINMGNSNYEKQKLLEEKERYLYDVLEGIPYGIITINQESIITYVNQQFEKMVHYGRLDMIGNHLGDLAIKSENGEWVLLQTFQSGTQGEEKESDIIDANGNKRRIKITTSRFYNEDLQTIGIIAVIQDISEMKLLEARLKQSDKLALIGQITAGLAHEIKNPLAILYGSAEMLLEEAEESECSEDIKELSADIYVVINRMKDIVDNFLNFAKVNKKQREYLSLQSILEEIIHLLRVKLNETKVHIIRQYENDPSIKGAYDQFIQVFLNLILNAIEAMPDGGSIIITIREENANVFVIIEDTGTGISEQDLQWLFNPFFSTKESGSGLGLTIARDILAEHDGKLELVSELGKGTTTICVFTR
ncbi:PAS domain S-box protein [Peribacillus muralis]|uniref:sensor histidine kinase n=1 Tax=Peribacillus muralis TaxID=264697 RepID=UPI001F4DD597|nr:PAS domain-containing sensor histidine kinase [Peribacillus muralis]MCK1992277.1 ATP-binding protein [Peribacillus muralis]MCK2012833.1 ATP-binding protein [Peribacillus muralis]